MRLYSTALALLAVASLSGRARGDDFAFRDGDTAVFLGDSITAAGGYIETIENYTLLRFPDRRVRFVNSGIGGDTAAGGLARLDRDVFAHEATVLVVAFGINDIGWGTKADDEHRRKFLDSIRAIVERCQAKGVRAYICSAAVTGENPDTADKGYFADMCREALDVARSLDAGAVDAQAAMREIQRQVFKANESAKTEREKSSLHVADGVHLSPLGELAMAFGILKGLGAPADVSRATIDARSARLVDAAGCEVTAVRGERGRLEFDRRDLGLPVNFGLFGALQFRFVPVPEQLNGYLLQIDNLPAGKYELSANDRKLGAFTAAQLAKGVNVASATGDPWQPGGPWDAQCSTVRELTEARHNVWQAWRNAAAYTPDTPALADLRVRTNDLISALEEAQRAAARPQTYRFSVRPIEE